MQELEDKSRRGEEVDRLKSVFIANMSHEIRTPLNSVLALSQLLRDGWRAGLTAEQRQYLEVIERNGQNLLRLINDILDLSRIEAGHLEMRHRDRRSAPHVRAIVAELAPLAMAKELELVVKLPETCRPSGATIDRVRQILTNLIGNAIKFTETGTVQVAAEAKAGALAMSGDRHRRRHPGGRLDKIFREFFQVDQTLARRQGDRAGAGDRQPAGRADGRGDSRQQPGGERLAFHPDPAARGRGDRDAHATLPREPRTSPIQAKRTAEETLSQGTS